MMKENWKKALALGAAGLAAAFVIAGCGSGTGGSAQGKETITVGTEGVVPKWTQNSGKSEDGGVEGYEIDVMKEIARRNNWNIKWQVGDFSGLFGMLDNKQIDTIASQVTITDERKQKYNFTNAYAYGSYVFVTKKEGAPKTVEWFKGKKVAVMAATNMQLALEDINEKDHMNLDIGHLDAEASVFPAVMNGTYDGAFCLSDAAYIAVKDLKMDLDIVDAHYKTLPIMYPFTKTEANDKRIAAINKTLSDMEGDGTLAKISNKWFGHDLSKKPEQ